MKILCKYLIKCEDENPWAKAASQKETRKPAETTVPQYIKGIF
jgi:hypothetical protein